MEQKLVIETKDALYALIEKDPDFVSYLRHVLENDATFQDKLADRLAARILATRGDEGDGRIRLLDRIRERSVKKAEETLMTRFDEIARTLPLDQAHVERVMKAYLDRQATANYARSGQTRLMHAIDRKIEEQLATIVGIAVNRTINDSLGTLIQDIKKRATDAITASVNAFAGRGG